MQWYMLPCRCILGCTDTSCWPWLNVLGMSLGWALWSQQSAKHASISVKSRVDSIIQQQLFTGCRLATARLTYHVSALVRQVGAEVAPVARHGTLLRNDIHVASLEFIWRSKQQHEISQPLPNNNASPGKEAMLLA